MSGQVWRDSRGEFQADERAGVARPPVPQGQRVLAERGVSSLHFLWVPVAENWPSH